MRFVNYAALILFSTLLTLVIVHMVKLAADLFDSYVDNIIIVAEKSYNNGCIVSADKLKHKDKEMILFCKMNSLKHKDNIRRVVKGTII